MFGLNSEWNDLSHKHVLISGGSKGLGKQVAIIAVKRGANVTILARNTGDLDKAVADLKSLADESQIIRCFAIDVTQGKQLRDLIEGDISRGDQGIPTHIISCAGRSVPGLFLDQSPEVYKQTMDLNYLGTINFILPCVQQLVADNKKGHVVIVASVLCYFGLIGYGTYAPSKFALRGLSECMRQELKPHGIKVHLCAPGTIFSEGFIEEQKVKPEVTKKIEGSDGSTPEAIATCLFRGLDWNYEEITCDFVSDLARCVGGGILRGNSSPWSRLKALLGWLVFYVFSFIVDSQVKAHYKK